MNVPTRIIDAHHHLWDLQACDYPWLMAKGVKRFFGDPTAIQRNYLVTDYLDDIGDLQVKASVHIQVGVEESQCVNETRWLQSVSGSENTRGLPNAIIAFCDLSSEKAMAAIEQHQESANLRGIRQIVGRSPEEDETTGTNSLLANPVWYENLSVLPERDLSFDLQLIPDQIPAVIEVFSKIPQLKVALCHCGSPFDQSKKGLARWRTHLGELAKLDNVSCKISGFGMFDHHWSIDSIQPIVETVLEVFTPERCMFGSNFPVDKLYCSYERLWKAYLLVTNTFSQKIIDRLFYQNAQDFYRIASIIK